MKLTLSYAHCLRVYHMVQHILNTPILVINKNHLMEWVYSLKDDYTWARLQLFVVMVMVFLTVKLSMEGPLITIILHGSYNLELVEI